MDANGNYSNEFEAAFDCSRRTQEYPRQQAKVDALVAIGRFVLSLHYTVYCNFTDALLGMAVVFVSDHGELAEAEAAQAALNGGDDDPEHYYQIDCHAPKSYISLDNDDNPIPF